MPFRRPAFDIEPFWQAESWIAAPAVDLVEQEKAFELTAELPGLDEKNVEVKVANGVLTIKGEKQEEKEEKNKDFHCEGAHASARSSARFASPTTVDTDKIEASFKKGVLTVMTAEDRRGAKASQEDRGERRLDW